MNSLKAKVLVGCAIAATLLSVAAVGDVAAATGTVWVYSGGEFKHVGGGNWEEYQNGQLRFRFRQIAHNNDDVFLYDASRGIEVRLRMGQATVTAGTTTVLTVNGQWRWQAWRSANGQQRFEHAGNGTWHEYQNGTRAFTFREVARNSDEVTIFDSSRGISVRLTVMQATVFSGPYTYSTSNGSWSR